MHQQQQQIILILQYNPDNCPGSVQLFLSLKMGPSLTNLG